MAFEDEFPSLSEEVNAPGCNYDETTVYAAWVESVQKHCKDNERIIEAARKVQKYIGGRKGEYQRYSGMYTDGATRGIKELLKELGLEGENVSKDN